MGKSVNVAVLTTVLRELFSRMAVPDLFWSDGGPQFTSKKFQGFAMQWGFRHQMSPHYPQSNIKAEATVKSMKKIVCSAWNGRYLDEDKLCKALLQYHTHTPSSRDGLSPAQKLFGYPI